MSKKDNKKRIIICGYPKSGTTWLTRLTAELIQCPVKGFWMQPNNPDTAIEGRSRISDFECYKAHHSVEALSKTFEEHGNGTEKVLYVVRDPRDVAVSASYYFHFPLISPFLRKRILNSGLKPLYRFLFNRFERNPGKMIKAMIKGNSNLAWIATPWEKHVEGYVESGVYIVRYEDLLDSTVQEAEKIVDYLGIERDSGEIELAVKNQSFNYKKRQFEKMNNKRNVQFLRKGRSGQWKYELTKKQLFKIERTFGDVMKRLGYL